MTRASVCFDNNLLTRDIKGISELHLLTMSDMYSTVAWAKTAADSKFSKIDIQRNVIGDHDVSFDLKYCGICHTDVHIANNDMGNTKVDQFAAGY